MSILALVAAALLPGAIARPAVTVHLVPHTHDDVGWVKTVDQYYAGLNNTIHHASVRVILDSVVESLRANGNRTFTYVEQAFFQRWWRQQSAEVQDQTRELVKSGQLTFTNGGWCMHDEAAPFYLDMIDQTTLGHRLLWEEFGVVPRTGWQLDPFGHSATQAALLTAEVGLVGLFFARIDYQDLEERVNSSSAEFIWRASESLGADAQVFTGLTGSYSGRYTPPQGFVWDVTRSKGEPVQDDPELQDYNVPSRVQDFVDVALWQAQHTRGRNVLWTMGHDFAYSNAREWYENLDRIIKYVNEDGRVAAVYSTPDKYLASKAAEGNSVKWPLKTDDFFPYADGPHKFWTGYFTSRPALKRYIRESSAFLQIMRQIGVLGGTAAAPRRGLELLSEAMGVAQHHDAVSGTEKQHVAFDYAARVARGRAAALPDAAAPLAKLAGAGSVVTPVVCDLRNVSVCAPTERVASGQAAELVFLLWNGLAQARTEVVELPAGSTGSLCVSSLSGGEAPTSQLVPSLPSVTNYGEDAGGSKQTLLFEATLPPLGFQAYKLTHCDRPPASAKASTGAAPAEEGQEVSLENEHVALRFSGGELVEMTDKATGVAVQAKQSWLFYRASEGDRADRQASGAYIFRPAGRGGGPQPVLGGRPRVAVARGPVADEVHQQFGPWVHQRVRLAKGARHAELLYTVGPVPVEDGVGKEVVSRIATGVANAGTCYTDSNGREMLRRRRDFRPGFSFNQTEPVAGNYYPVTAAAFIRDKAAQVTVLTDASQAGSGCVADGEVELMVHRRLLRDDGKGVGEPLNETKGIDAYNRWLYRQGARRGPGLVTRGRHLLTVSAPSSAAATWRPLLDRTYMQPLPVFFEGDGRPSKGTYSALAQALPANVQLLSLDWWDEGRVLLRLAHQFGIGEDLELSKPVELDLAGLFAEHRVISVDERGLAATISRQEVLARRIPWSVEGEPEAPPPARPSEVAPQQLEARVELGPLQIRTFLLGLQPTKRSLRRAS